MRKNRHKITTCEAAIILGTSPQFVRIAMQRDVLKIGIAMQMPHSTNYTYNISPKLLSDYSGKDVEKELVKIRAEDFCLENY